MNGKLKALLVVSLAFNLSVLAALTYGWVRHSQTGRAPLRHERELDRIDRRCRRLADRISLPGDKAEHLERIMVGEEEEHKLIRDRLHEARGELFEMVWADEPDEQAVMEKVEEVAKLQGELEKLFTQRLLKARSILDPEEEKRFHDHMMRRMDRLFGDEKRPHRYPHRDGGRR
jgi:Spy/CpxP family protein refolding chaperone